MDVEWQWWKQNEDTEGATMAATSCAEAAFCSDVTKRKAMKPVPSTLITTDKIPLRRERQGREGTPFGRLEEVLDIVRLHRLGDDLDLQSLCHLRLTSKTVGKIAARVLQARVPKIELCLAPFTDGFAVLGHSRFFRRLVQGGSVTATSNDIGNNGTGDEDQETTIHFEHGRPVEYVRCGMFPLERIVGATTNLYSDPKLAFRWSCEELLLANLDRMFGEIAFREYRGQKMCLFWKPTGADALVHNMATTVKVAEVWIEASPVAGKQVCMINHSQLEFQIVNSQTREDRDIMVEYEGTMAAISFHLDLRTLTDI